MEAFILVRICSIPVIQQAEPKMIPAAGPNLGPVAPVASPGYDQGHEQEQADEVCREDKPVETPGRGRARVILGGVRVRRR